MTAVLRVFVVDDEPPARTRMRQLLADEQNVVVVGEAADAVEARDAIAACRPDVVFLDVEMPEVSGTSLARSLPEPRPLVVFATAFDRYALDAFSVDAADYLVKPITRARLATTLARLRERLSRRSDLERELAAASATQAALLPRTIPEMPGLDAAALTLPARGVGGDFLVAERISDRRFVLALGDVAGKGMSAGLVASSLQARLETVSRHGAGTAEDVVAEVNRTLCATSDGSRFATLAYLEIDPARSELTLVNAGHPSLLLIGPDAALRHLASTAPALGLIPGAAFSSQRFTMSAGATLFAYSDGVTEAFDAAGEEFGEDKLVSTLTAYALTASGPGTGRLEPPSKGAPRLRSGLPAADLCRRVVDAVRAHTPGPAGDDITVMAIIRGVW